MASSYDVLGDASEYQEWLASQSPVAPTADSQDDDTVHQVQEVQDLPAEIAHIVENMEQQHAAAVLTAYRELQRFRYAQPDYAVKV